MSTAPLPGEDALIARLAAVLPPARQTSITIGDDAAVFPLPAGRHGLLTTDLLMEDVHFRLAWDDWAALGWKALAQNLSDIAAMGGTPTHAVIGLAVPPRVAAADLVTLYTGMAALAREAGVDLVGGDTIRSSGPLTLALTVFGEAAPEMLCTRAGAHPGEALFVTGTLGRAAAGLRLLESGAPIPTAFQAAVEAQLRPQPRLAAGRALAASGQVTAMMDLSDGVATDLHRLCRASGTGAVVDMAALPIDPVVAEAVAWLAMRAPIPSASELAIAGGEDFELLCTAPPAAEASLRAALAPLPLTRIGTVSAPPDILRSDEGQQRPLVWGFTHF